jgi:GNAT superfamily N-acetyltransferase
MSIDGAEHVDVRVRSLTPERWDDLAVLFGPRGAYAGCWCMWWRVSRAEFARRSATERRAAFRALVDAGEVPGLLAYADGEPAAWCSLGPREHFPSLERSPTLKRVGGAPVWSIVCFYVARPYRRRGLSAALIRACADYAATRGAGLVEAQPVDPLGGPVDVAAAFTGLLPAFLDAGFVEVARRSPRRPIVRLALPATQSTG